MPLRNGNDLLLLFLCIMEGRDKLDVKTAFLNANLDEKIYVSQMPDFISTGKESLVYILHKALYAIIQASREWCKTLKSFFVNHGLESS